VSKKLHITCKINGKETDFLCEARNSLLEVLRDELKLTGAKEGCNNGNCGACNVILDGRLVNSCLVMAPEVQGHSITTIEGVAGKEALHPVQQCFLEGAALQCGICTPGFIVAATALLDKTPHPTEHDARHFLAGNLCRCTGYDKIIRAVLEASECGAKK
jgi:carbon-monoxide dehydrogenase small subunit